MKDKRILIQGAMDIEIEYFLSKLKNRKNRIIAGYEFYEGSINDIEVVISKTLVGTINSTMATTIGIINFHPNIIINQGIAGAHRTDLHIGDIIIGEKCCNINAYKMPIKARGEGSNPFEWMPNKRAKDVQIADIKLVNIIAEKLNDNKSKKIYKGTLGSGDVHNREIDRIIWLNNMFENCSEDMESIGAYYACSKFNIPCVGIRIISNNDILLEKLDKTKVIELQIMLIDILNDLVSPITYIPKEIHIKP